MRILFPAVAAAICQLKRPPETPEELLKSDHFGVQHNQNDEPQRASEHCKFWFATWTTRRLIGQLISVGHKNHLSSKF
jgi:hypothetical protein